MVMARRTELGRISDGGVRMMDLSGGGDGCDFFGFVERVGRCV